MGILLEKADVHEVALFFRKPGQLVIHFSEPLAIQPSARADEDAEAFSLQAIGEPSLQLVELGRLVAIIRPPSFVSLPFSRAISVSTMILGGLRGDWEWISYVSRR
jgi:hypothetical protein